MSQDDSVRRFEIEAVGPQGSAGERRIIVTLNPDADGTFAWIDGTQHDVEGAIRAFRYLAEKAQASYDADDVRGQRVLASIAKHMGTFESLKVNVFDKIFKGG